MNPSAEPVSQTVLDELDKQLLNGMQFDFPLSLSPWEALAQGTGLTGEQVLSRVKKLKSFGCLGIPPQVKM